VWFELKLPGRDRCYFAAPRILKVLAQLVPPDACQKLVN
jgi:hypothetical protein